MMIVITPVMAIRHHGQFNSYVMREIRIKAIVRHCEVERTSVDGVLPFGQRRAYQVIAIADGRPGTPALT